MNKKFSIVKGIDLDILNEKIDEYMKCNNEYPYIFMDEETVDKLPTIKGECMTEKLKSSGMIGYYAGNKLFVDNTLDFGEVELR